MAAGRAAIPVPRIILDATVVSSRGKGLSRYAVNLLWHLATVDDARYLVLLDGDVDLPPLPESPNFTYRLVKARPGLLWRQVRLPLLLRRERHDLLHIFGEIAPSRSLLRSPLVLTATELPGIRQSLQPASSLRESLSHRLYAALFPRSLRSADLILSISETTRADLLDQIALNPAVVKTVPLAAGPQFAEAFGAARLTDFRGRLGFAGGYILAFATGDGRENVDLLCDSWKALIQDGRVRETLLFAGAGSDGVRRTLSELIGRHGIADRTGFAGYIPDEDMPLLYAAATCYVDCSRYEGFGLQSLEAMASGTAVVASDIAATREVVNDGGLLYPVDDRDGLVAALRRVLGDPVFRLELIEKGRRRARDYSWEETARLTREAYREVLEGRKAT